MIPSEILSVADYERPRTLEEFASWWPAKFNLFAETKAGRDYARNGTGLSKKFHDEAQPMLAFMNYRRPATGIRCKLLADTGAADAEFLDASGNVLHEFQITTAVDGYTEALRRRQLSRFGHVDGLSKPNADGIIPDDALPINRDHLIQEMAGYILERVGAKNLNDYGLRCSLIVTFQDGIFDANDIPRLQALVGRPQHKFADLLILGIHGRIALF